MKSSRIQIVLLAVIAVAVLVIAAVLVLGATDREHTDAWRDARDEASEGARFVCTAGDDAAKSEAIDECIDDHVKIQLEEWESEHPDDVWK